MSTAFYDYVRGITDEVPEGYTLKGMKVYRFLVYLGASQMIESCYPDLRSHLGEEGWETLIRAFIRGSAWTSHFYGDLENEFRTFLEKLSSESLG